MRFGFRSPNRRAEFTHSSVQNLTNRCTKQKRLSIWPPLPAPRRVPRSDAPDVAVPQEGSPPRKSTSCGAVGCESQSGRSRDRAAAGAHATEASRAARERTEAARGESR